MGESNQTYQDTMQTPAMHLVEIPLELRGKAAPPLYDGYRSLLTALTHVTLHHQPPRKVTDRIRNCAARILCYLNEQQDRTERVEGLPYSRAEFQTLFRNEYSIESIEVAQALLITSQLVLPPSQDGATDRSFYWRIDAHRLREAFAQLEVEAHQKKAARQRFNHPDRPPLSLVATQHTTPEPASEVEGQTLSEIDDRFHGRKSGHRNDEIPASMEGVPGLDAQKSRHASGKNQASIQAFPGVDGGISPRAPGAIDACNSKILKERKERKEDPFPPSFKMEEKGSRRHLSQIHEEAIEKAHPTTMALVTSPVFPPMHAPETPETILTVFDAIRGWRLTGKLLALAKAAASELVSGKPEIQRPPFSRLQIELIALYLRYHDPYWQANYEQLCQATGIPEVWSVNKVAASKWPLALRHYISTGEYIHLEDGTLLSQTQYQAWLEDEQRRFETEMVYQQAAQELEETRQQEGNEPTTHGTISVGEQAPCGAFEATGEDEPEGWLHPSDILDHLLKTLDQALPPGYDILLEPIQGHRMQIVIINQANSEDWMPLRDEVDVSQLMEWAQHEQAHMAWHPHQEYHDPSVVSSKTVSVSPPVEHENPPTTSPIHALLLPDPVEGSDEPCGWDHQAIAR